ncbi:MAG: putative quinol monooxygenase [Thiolinea sp.]
MIHVIAVITAKSGQRDNVLTAFKANVPAVHAEQGCVEYRPVVDAVGAGAFQTALGPDSFMVIEKWETMADLDAHAASAHMADYANKVKDMIAERAVHVLTDVE